MTHTPTPWKKVDVWSIIATQIKGKPLVATAGCDTQVEKDERIANAEFIVLACNCHDELLEACKAAYERGNSDGMSYGALSDEICDKLEAAIGKATERV